MRTLIHTGYYDVNGLHVCIGDIVIHDGGRFRVVVDEGVFVVGDWELRSLCVNSDSQRALAHRLGSLGPFVDLRVMGGLTSR